MDYKGWFNPYIVESAIAREIGKNYITIAKAAEAFSIQTVYSFNDCINMIFQGIRKGEIQPIEEVAATKFCPNCGAKMVDLEEENK